MTEKAPASKSEAKRVSAQKSRDTSVIKALEARVEVLEARQKIIVDAFQFTADECRPIYGLGGIAVIFDTVAKKLK